VKVDHDQNISLACDSKWNNAQCSRYLKTRVGHIFNGQPGVNCYLDNDVLAVSDDAIKIFDHYKPPITFGRDPGKTVRKFSGFAIRDGTSLSHAIKRKFNLKVDDDWPIWNGGMFLFNDDSKEFLHTWHDLTMQIFSDPTWRVRDQGTLIATVWKLKMQDHYTFPWEFNWLHKLKRGLIPQKDNSFKSRNGTCINFVHFPSAYGDDKSECWRTAMRIIS
jgi:hypothetical protein